MCCTGKYGKRPQIHLRPAGNCESFLEVAHRRSAFEDNTHGRRPELAPLLQRFQISGQMPPLTAASAHRPFPPPHTQTPAPISHCNLAINHPNSLPLTGLNASRSATTNGARRKTLSGRKLSGNFWVGCEKSAKLWWGEPK